MNKRRVALLVMLCALLILLIAPVVLLDRPAAKTGDPAYRQLDVIARSLSGDHSADLEAAEALGVVEQQRKGSGVVYRANNGTSCWELDLSTAEKPYRVRC